MNMPTETGIVQSTGNECGIVKFDEKGRVTFIHMDDAPVNTAQSGKGKDENTYDNGFIHTRSMRLFRKTM